MWEKEIDRLFQSFDKDGSPGFSVAVRYKGELLYRKAFGMADIGYGIPNTPETVFHVASVSKQFTAFCILLLAEEGRISLDDPIRKYIPALPSYCRKITIRHLLHHTGGLREQWDLFTLAGNSMEDLATRDAILRLVCSQYGVNFEPGERYCYCNTGFTLLAQAIEAVTGQTLRVFAGERIFRPLGMSRTYFRDNHAEIVHDRASSYGAGDRPGSFARIALNFDVAGSTSLNTTVDDLMKWIANFDQLQVGSKDVIRRLFHKGRLNNGTEIDYCCGIKRYSYRGVEVREHTGANSGYRSGLLSAVDVPLDVVVLSNYEYSFPLAKAYRIMDLLAGEELEPMEESAYDTSASGNEALREGLYATDDFSLAQVVKNGGNVVLRHEKISWIYLHTGGNRFECEENGSRIYLMDNGEIRRDTAAAFSIYRPVLEQTVPEKELSGWTGLYYSPELQTAYRLDFEDGRMTICHMKTGKIRFIKISENKFLAVNRDNLALTLKSENGARSFRMSTGRTRDLPFFKVEGYPWDGSNI